MATSAQSESGLSLTTLSGVFVVGQSAPLKPRMRQACSQACRAAGMLAPKYFVAIGARYCVCLDATGRLLYVRLRNRKSVEWAWSPRLLSTRLKTAARRVLGEFFAVRV